MKYGVPQFLRDQFRPLPKPSSYAPNLSGKSVIITGANIGLGYEAAKHLAAMHPGRLILACRDAKKGNDAAAKIRAATNCDSLEVWTVDISSSESVKAFAAKYAAEGGGKLDILVENAGVNVPKLERTKDGWERNIGTNHLGTSHLVFRMLPFLLQAPSPRLVILASDVHYFVEEPKEANRVDLLTWLNKDTSSNKFDSFDGIQRYNVSKLLNVLWSEALAAHIPSSSPLTVTAVNPGFCVSSLLRDHGVGMAIFNHLVGRSTEVGSRTIVHAAVAPDVQGKTGLYLSSCLVTEPSDYVISKEGAQARETLWAETLQILSAMDPEVGSIAQRYLTSKP